MHTFYCAVKLRASKPNIFVVQKVYKYGRSNYHKVSGRGGGARWWHINSCPPPPFSLHPTLPFSLYFPSHKNFDDNFMLPFLKPLAHRHHPSGVFSSASCLIFFLLFQGNRQTLRRQALDYFLPSVVDKSLSSEVQVAD